MVLGSIIAGPGRRRALTAQQGNISHILEELLALVAQLGNISQHLEEILAIIVLRENQLVLQGQPGTVTVSVQQGSILLEDLVVIRVR